MLKRLLAVFVAISVITGCDNAENEAYFESYLVTVESNNPSARTITEIVAEIGAADFRLPTDFEDDGTRYLPLPGVVISPSFQSDRQSDSVERFPVNANLITPQTNVLGFAEVGFNFGTTSNQKPWQKIYRGELGGSQISFEGLRVTTSGFKETSLVVSHRSGPIQYSNPAFRWLVLNTLPRFDEQGQLLIEDSDDDLVIDEYDNCRLVPNTAQENIDRDPLGDSCDIRPTDGLVWLSDQTTDFDGDGVDNLLDNCAEAHNASQRDTDRDGLGDVCDAQTGGQFEADVASFSWDDEGQELSGFSDEFQPVSAGAVAMVVDHKGENLFTASVSNGLIRREFLFPTTVVTEASRSTAGSVGEAENAPYNDLLFSPHERWLYAMRSGQVIIDVVDLWKDSPDFFSIVESYTLPGVAGHSMQISPDSQLLYVSIDDGVLVIPLSEKAIKVDRLQRIRSGATRVYSSMKIDPLGNRLFVGFQEGSVFGIEVINIDDESDEYLMTLHDFNFPDAQKQLLFDVSGDYDVLAIGVRKCDFCDADQLLLADIDPTSSEQFAIILSSDVGSMLTDVKFSVSEQSIFATHAVTLDNSLNRALSELALPDLTVVSRSTNTGLPSTVATTGATASYLEAYSRYSFIDMDFDGLHDLVDPSPLEAACNPDCVDVKFNDLKTGGVTAGVLKENSGATVRISDAWPNPDQGILIEVSGAQGDYAMFTFPEFGFEVIDPLTGDVNYESGIEYILYAPTSMTIKRTGSGKIQVAQGRVDMKVPGLGISLDLAEGDQVHVVEAAANSVQIDTIVGRPVGKADGVTLGVATLSTGSSIRIAQSDPAIAPTLEILGGFVDLAGVATMQAGEKLSLEAQAPFLAIPPAGVSVPEFGVIELTAPVVDFNGESAVVRWDIDGDGIFEIEGSTLVLEASQLGDVTEIVAEVCNSSGACRTSVYPVEIVNAPPVANLDGSVTGINQVTLDLLIDDASNDDEHSLFVNWGDAATTNIVLFDPGQAITHTYDAPGEYEISIRVCDSSGACDVQTKVVAVDPLCGLIPAPDFGEYEQLVCEGKSVVRSQSELELYLQDFGREGDVIKNLVVGFNPQGAINIETPCAVRIRGGRGEAETLSNIDVYAGGNLVVNHRQRSAFVASGDVSLVSARRIKIGEKQHLAANNICLQAGKRIKLESRSHMVAQDLSLESAGRVQLGNKVSIASRTLQVNAANSKQCEIHRRVNINADTESGNCLASKSKKSKKKAKKREW